MTSMAALHLVFACSCIHAWFPLTQTSIRPLCFNAQRSYTRVILNVSHIMLYALRHQWKRMKQILNYCQETSWKKCSLRATCLYRLKKHLCLVSTASQTARDCFGWLFISIRGWKSCLTPIFGRQMQLRHVQINNNVKIYHIQYSLYDRCSTHFQIWFEVRIWHSTPD